MPEGIGASGIVGVAFEATAGVYTAPTKFFPIKSENLLFDQGVTKRRVIRGTPDPIGSVKGNGIVSGNMAVEVLPDVAPYFLYASRADVVKTGTGPYIYTAKGNAKAAATTGRTLSITIVRNEVVFGYTGCVVSSSSYSIQDGIMMADYAIVGEEEDTESTPTPVWPTSEPFGMGTYSLEFDDVVDDTVSDLTISIEDNATGEHRLAGGTGADFVRFGERTTKVSVNRDFLTRAEYDKYKALTAAKFELTTTRGTESVKWTVPVGVMNSYEIGMSNPGDLIRASIEYEGDYHAATGASWEMIVTSATENIT